MSKTNFVFFQGSFAISFGLLRADRAHSESARAKLSRLRSMATTFPFPRSFPVFSETPRTKGERNSLAAESSVSPFLFRPFSNMICASSGSTSTSRSRFFSDGSVFPSEMRTHFFPNLLAQRYHSLIHYSVLSFETFLPEPAQKLVDLSDSSFFLFFLRLNPQDFFLCQVPHCATPLSPSCESRGSRVENPFPSFWGLNGVRKI